LQDEGTINRRVESLEGKSEYDVIGKAARAKTSDLDSLTWLSESREASREYAYTHEVLGPVKAIMEEGASCG
jgi:hypothetical protein